jgi:cellulose synthase/poly-beta-1,6-N-acetylglucosamine synthase-like glycosyltransferase
MHGFSLFLQFALSAVLISVSALSAQLVALACVRCFRKAPRLALFSAPEEDLPEVLVQLPVCNEGALAARVAAAAAAMDWPADRLTIQLLDDGDSDKHDALAEAVARVIPQGVAFQCLRRGDRTGFKAGNLAFGLRHSNAPYVAIFDADFVPPSDFLRRTIPVLTADPGLSFVQTRWGFANRDLNWLTRVQGILLDAHFAVEQEARIRAGLPISFNGTAGVWNREAIDNGGGWTGDTLTEDLDLAMRCAMKGWRTAMLPDVEVPSELPETAAAWHAQQGRWTKGHAQVARKLLPQVWSSEMPLWKKAVMTLQMCQFAFYILAFASAAIGLGLIYVRADMLLGITALGLAASFFGLCASLGYLYLGQYMLGRQNRARLVRSLLLSVVFPSGLILANTRATFEAFFSTRMDFHRTLRAGETPASGWCGGPELVAGVLLPAFAFSEHQAWSALFFFFAVTGLVSIGGMGLFNRLSPPRSRARISAGE